MMGVLRSKFIQAVVVLVGTFLLFRFGIRPPAPWSVITLYMVIVLVAVLVYVSSDSDSWRAFLTPIRSTLVEDSNRPIRLTLMVLLPPFFGYYAYIRAAPRFEAPAELRAVHPAPPASITFRGKTMDLQGLENPLRKDPANFTKYVTEGSVIYIKHCVHCHGDNLDGNGHFAHAFNPVPAHFTDPGMIAMLQEAFLFWRIAKGGRGLPKESTPWNSVMPAWEDRFSEEEIWKVILYLYDATGYQPRRWETQASATPSPLTGYPLGALSPRGERENFGSSPAPRGYPGERERRAGVIGNLVSRVWAQQPGDAGAGKVLYDKKCALCHGEAGKGDGPGAATLYPNPRDFTTGMYKIRTTATGSAPTDADLFRVITDGMPGTSMPPWGMLPEKDRWNLVAYLKTFAPEKFKEPPKPADPQMEVASSKPSLARGKEMFEAIECHKCHGNAGRGDGPSAPELKDDWGNPIRPANLTKPWTFRGGASARAVATRLLTGLAGTPMPSFADSVEQPEDIWHLANYVTSLGPEKLSFATILPVQAVQGEIPDDPAAAFWDQQPPASFPLAGQVIVDPRNFSPSIDMITVRAVHSDTEIAFHLSWDDPTASEPSAADNKFADQVALQFPAKLSEGPERPYVLMGDGANPVYLLRWTSNQGLEEANASGLGRITPVYREKAQAKGRVVYQDGRYRLVIKCPRARATPANVPPFPVGNFIPVAFFAWDGDNGEAGTKFSMSSWYYLRLEPPPSVARWIYPPLVAGAVFGLELWGLWWVRRRTQGLPTEGRSGGS